MNNLSADNPSNPPLSDDGPRQSGPTPGPWSVRITDTEPLYAPEIVCIIQAGSQWMCVVAKGQCVTDEQRLPNAHLIAAALEHNAALEAIQWGQVEIGPGGEAYYLCPECDRSEVRGHQSDCAVGNALAKAGSGKRAE